jgi:hypothetical protein
VWVEGPGGVGAWGCLGAGRPGGLKSVSVVVDRGEQCRRLDLGFRVGLFRCCRVVVPGGGGGPPQSQIACPRLAQTFRAISAADKGGSTNQPPVPHKQKATHPRPPQKRNPHTQEQRFSSSKAAGGHSRMARNSATYCPLQRFWPIPEPKTKLRWPGGEERLRNRPKNVFDFD